MSFLWSPQKKFSTWRHLWLALAEAEQELGLPISDAQLDELREHLDDIDFDVAARHEKIRRHDVMAHVETYGELCPQAKPIIHLGATSCYVTDNTDIILLRESLKLVRDNLVRIINQLAEFAQQYRDLPCLGFTHLQSAQRQHVRVRPPTGLLERCPARQPGELEGLPSGPGEEQDHQDSEADPHLRLQWHG
jgi:adenylosuccinate lyase